MEISKNRQLEIGKMPKVEKCESGEWILSGRAEKRKVERELEVWKNRMI